MVTGTLSISQLPSGTVVFGNDIIPITHGITGSATPPQTQAIPVIALRNFTDGYYQPSGTSNAGRVLLETKTLAHTGTFNFNLSTYSAYSTFEIDIVARSNVAGNSDFLYMQLNNDTSNKYSYRIQWSTGNTERSSTGTWNTSFIPGATSPAGLYNNSRLILYGANGVGFLPNFQSRGMQITTGLAGGFFIYDSEGYYSQFGATSLQAFAGPGNSFISGSVAKLYGVP